MIRLSAWLIRAQFLTRRAASALSMLAIALGVALGYAIHLINAAALADFSRAMNAVQGEPDVVIAPRDPGAGIPLSLVDAISRDDAVALAVPVIENRVRVEGVPLTAKLIGLDPFSAASMMPTLLPREDPAANSGILDGGIYVAGTLIRSQELDAGKAITLVRGDSRWTTRIAGHLPDSGSTENLLVADVAWVQAHLGPANGVGELRLRLTQGANPESWRKAWTTRLPAGIDLRLAEDNQARISNISRAYRVNLNVLAMVALLTGGFLVFATQLTAVAQRSTQFALLGVLGLPPHMRLHQILLEGLAIGIPGSATGLILGHALAVTFTRFAGGDLGGGFFASSAPRISMEVFPALGFFALGCAASLLGALYPAWLNRTQALAQSLKTGFSQSPAYGPARQRTRLWALALLAATALGLTRAGPIVDLPMAGYLAIALVLVLGIVAAPLATRIAFGTMAGSELPAPLRVGVQNVVQAPLMAQVAASGLIVSFALTVSMVTMVSSFRTALDDWLEQVLPAPHYVRSKGLPLPGEMLAELTRGDSLFSRVERMSASSVSLDPKRPAAALLVRDVARAQLEERLPFTGSVVAAPSGTTPVWVSEALQEIHGLQPGQTLRLPLLGREIEVFIGGVWRDYARQFGAVVISAEDYRLLGGSFEPTDLALWPHTGMEAAARSWIAAHAARHGFDTGSSNEIRELSLSIFDKSFAVTHALEAAAMLIGLFGLAVTLAASIWLRSRELATLAALGFDRSMLSRAVVFEGALITVIGLLLGLACGIAVGAILTHVVNPQAFHWRMPLRVPWSEVFPVALATLTAGALASALAARQATRLPAAQILAGAQ